jgi:hypothetical protein
LIKNVFFINHIYKDIMINFVRINFENNFYEKLLDTFDQFYMHIQTLRKPTRVTLQFILIVFYITYYIFLIDLCTDRIYCKIEYIEEYIRMKVVLKKSSNIDLCLVQKLLKICQKG